MNWLQSLVAGKLIKKLENELEATKAELSELKLKNDNVVELKTRLTQVNAEVSTLRVENTNLKSQKNLLEDEVRSLTEKVTMLEAVPVKKSTRKVPVKKSKDERKTD